MIVSLEIDPVAEDVEPLLQLIPCYKKSLLRRLTVNRPSHPSAEFVTSPDYPTPVTDNPTSTTALLLAATSGDNEALGNLLIQYRGYLLMLAHRYLSSQLRRRIDPADVVQVTFLEAKRDLQSFRGAVPAEFAGWLRGILKNNIASALSHHVMTQKRSTKKEVPVGAVGGDGDSSNNWIAQLPGGLTSPSGVAVRAEAVLAMMDALHQLPETQAEAIRLRYMEGLPLKEIVERMGKTDTAVAGLLKRGLQKMRTLLDTGSSPWWTP